VRKGGRGDRSELDFEVSTSSTSIIDKDTIIIKDAFPIYVEPGNTMYLIFQQIQTPVSSAETSSFDFLISEIYEGNLYQIEGNKVGVSIRTDPLVLTSYYFSTSNK